MQQCNRTVDLRATTTQNTSGKERSTDYVNHDVMHIVYTTDSLLTELKEPQPRCAA